VTYNGARAWSLAQYIGDVPGIVLKGLSKELPWPGGALRMGEISQPPERHRVRQAVHHPRKRQDDRGQLDETASTGYTEEFWEITAIPITCMHNN
jgi:hypothetical protein